MANNSQRGLSWIVWLLIGILVIALLLPLVVKVGGGYYRWGFGKSTKEEVVFQCPPCPECPTAVSQPNVVADEAIQPVTDYSCNAVDLGNGGPVGEAGSCKFCTINYTRPGQVFIAEEDAIKYDETAWVWQYNSTDDLDAFQNCIKGQPFYTDDAYQPVWP
jgi:hypothetical protein